MDNSVNIIVKYGGLVALKGSSGLTFQALVDFVCSKWQCLNASSIIMTYMVVDCGECIIADDEDLVSMFALMRELSLVRINIVVKGAADIVTRPIQHVDAPIRHSHTQMTLPMISYDKDVEDTEDRDLEKVDAVVEGKKLLSADWIYLIKDVGQVFEGGVADFRKAKFSIEMGFEYEYIKNESYRVTAVCKYKHEKQCCWRIHASVDKYSKFCSIRTYDKHHTCGMFFGTANKKRLSADIIIDLIAGEIRSRPEAERKNPGSLFHLEIDDVKKNFRRCFFAFAPCMEGFRFGRPVVMLDGTFFKGKHKGMLLSTVEKDGDQRLFPIAFAIVDEETDCNWSWFLNHLKVAIGMDRVFTFVSNRNHGILVGVQNVFPHCLHGYCYKHLKENLKDRFRGESKIYRKAVVRQFRDCAYAATKPEFEICLEKFKRTGGGRARKFLADIPKEKWSNAYFEGPRYGQMTSNGSESWNAQLMDERFLIVTSLIDGIRSKIMEQLCDRLIKGTNWHIVLTFKIDKIMKDIVDKARPWLVKQAFEFVWEMYSDPTAIIDVREKTCSCRQWQVTGLPCFHAVGIIFLKKKGRYDLIDDKVFHTSAYRQTYASPIFHLLNLLSTLKLLS
ncbi:PREDICTED: uncharacterized protein LOC105973193 [Erythranthe guttata]|uniref:uncharacterized protein LOC105973193 n=1 Tax=Erythranthe guttata TaxID=4155 RepID=UPI00064DC9B6|nr:PREDICTED: uncharacterized protein LOC105973193 [Erythranthe guttata]|eukprot:XP_012853666.1 PREDICTED: uncharacterized protein LOC105973193 [Erythranthe guttata]